jgi:two-component system response regulator NreC
VGRVPSPSKPHQELALAAAQNDPSLVRANSTSMPVRILLADDHHVVREGLRLLLEAEEEFTVVGEAADGLETIKRTESLRPDIAIVDLMMPGLSGLEVTRQISQRVPRTRIIILSMYGNEAYVLEALRNGAVGYVLKGSLAVDLLQAVREVAAGRHYLGPPLSELAIEAYLDKAKNTMLDPYETLTTREREVLHLAAEGRTNAEIATALGIGSRTVETHRIHLTHKLGLRTRTDLIRYALQRGIVPLEG